MKNIICLIESLGSGGAERQLVCLASLLKEKGYNVEVWTYYPNDFYAHLLESSGVNWKYISQAQSKFRRLFVLSRELAKVKPDSVIAYLDTCTSLACFIKLLGGKFNLIVSERNTTQELTLRERIKFFMYRWADYIVPNSRTQTEFISNNYSHLSVKLHMISNFIDTSRFYPLTKENENGICRILTVARIAPQKNVLKLLAVVKKLKDSGLSFKYDWFGNFGSEQYYNQCVDFVENNQLEDVFEFHNHSKDIVVEYQHSDMFCLPSIYEGYPNVICEAMACGLPIVCSNVCDNGTLVENGLNGYLFSPFSTEDMFSTLKVCIENYLKLKQMRLDARNVALQRFNKDNFIESYCRLIER